MALFWGKEKSPPLKPFNTKGYGTAHMAPRVIEKLLNEDFQLILIESFLIEAPVIIQKLNIGIAIVQFFHHSV